MFTFRAIEAVKVVQLTLIFSFLVLREQLVNNFCLQLNHRNAALFLFKICSEKLAGKSNVPYQMDRQIVDKYCIAYAIWRNIFVLLTLMPAKDEI